MSKILFVGDVHIEKRLFNIPLLAQDNFDAFRDVVDYACDNKFDQFCLVGDEFDNSAPSAESVSFMKASAETLYNNDVQPIAIQGDHTYDPAIPASWVRDVCGWGLPDKERFISLDYCADPEKWYQTIETQGGAGIEFIVGHGMIKQVLPDFILSEKKLLDLDRIDFSKLPNLKGIVFGDIHNPIAGEYKGIPIHYTGSLGVTELSEIKNKKGLLVWEHDHFKRIPFKLKREIIEINFLPPTHTGFDASSFEKEYESQPVFIVRCDKKSYADRQLFDKLYDIGFVLPVKEAHQQQGDTEEVIDIREEIKDNSRSDNVLRECLRSKEGFNLAKNLLTSENPKIVLDQFLEQKENLDE